MRGLIGISKLLSVLLLFFGAQWSMGQDKRIQGKIANEKDVEGIHIINASSRFNTVTNENGEFYIHASVGDTLIISSINYLSQQLEINASAYQHGYLGVHLEDLVNQLDEVFLGPRLTGDLSRDISTIKIEDPINFDDVGIPGFKGKPQEKIPKMLGEVIAPFSINVEGLYKHLNGYYKKLKLKRKWDGQNNTVAYIMNHYSLEFFETAYEIPKERVYDFLLFCAETSNIEATFWNQNYAIVLEIFENHSEAYSLRLSEKRE